MKILEKNQEWLAEKIRVTRQAVSNYVSGIDKPRKERAELIEKLIGEKIWRENI